MQKKTALNDSPRKSSAARKTKPKSTKLGRTLIKGMTEILAHVRGEIELESYTIPAPVDVRAIRRRAGMSQAKFAAAYALNPRTLQDWEQHKSEPDGAVRAYLTVIDRNPDAVVAALRS
jgi:putative transcriptional regulator